ncbi:MAG: hypothetical protein ACOX7U_07550 [Desulfitobacteriia bacterium]
MEEAIKQLERLTDAGIDFSINIIIGGAGKGRGYEHALANSKLLNRIKPKLIFVGGLHLEPGSQLEKDIREGVFVESTLRENIEEEIEMLKRLELENTIFFGLHPSNAVQAYGLLPTDKEKILATLEKGLNTISKEYLDAARLEKGPEGNLSFIR